MARVFECYTFSPEVVPGPADFPADCAVAMGAPVASVVRGITERPGNLGAHAAELARRLGTKVLAYQDLGPNVSFPELRTARYQMHPDNFSEYAAETAQALTRHAASEGIQRLAFRIHSGNGPLGTQLALTLHDQQQGNKLAPHVTHMAISDPVGMQEIGFGAGLRTWLRYVVREGRHMPADQRMDPGQPPSTIAAFVRDLIVRSPLWRTAIALDNLHKIHRREDVAVLLHLPGRTFNGTPDYMGQLAAMFPERPAGAVPFRVEYERSHFHGTAYDSFAGNEAMIRRTLALAPFRPV